MANSYSQIYIHIVFAVQNRISIISEKWDVQLYKYISGILNKIGHKLIIVNGHRDHIHLLIGLKPVQSISDLAQIIKCNSAKWINESNFVVGKFSWQEGYGVFSYSKSQLPKVIKYIENQKEHHKKVNFGDEYFKILKDFDIDFDPEFIFKTPE